MATRFFIRVRGRVRGPYDEEHVQSLVRRGQFGRMHEISEDGNYWVRADSFPQFFFTVTPGNMPEDDATAADSREALRPAAAGNGDNPTPATALVSKPATTSQPLAPEKDAWFYVWGEQQCGPASLSYMQSLVNSRRLAPSDLVWKEGMPEWLIAESVPELFGRSAPAHLAAPTYARVSAIAVASLVLALFWLLGIGSLLAIIFGAIALYQIRISNGYLAGTGIALGGLILGSLGFLLTLAAGIITLIGALR
jgi:hypothetical protein